jgi:hypothetical protein
MLKAATVGFPVLHIEGHGVRICAKDRWLVHVVPEVIQVAGSREIIVAELLAPV